MTAPLYVSGMSGTITCSAIAGGATIGNCTDITLPASKAASITQQGLGGPQVLGGQVTDYGQLSFTMPLDGSVSYVPASAAVTAPITHLSFAVFIAELNKTFTVTGFILSDEPGRMVVNQAIERKITVQADALYTEA